MNRLTQSTIRTLAAVAFAIAPVIASAQVSTFVTLTNHTQEATTWCGAAAGQMIMTGYPNPPATPCNVPQANVWAAIQAAKVEPSWDTDPRGLRAAMTTLCPLPPGGSWVVFDNANANSLMFNVAYWMKKRKYPVAVLLTTAPHNSVATHKEKWAVIKGIVTDVDPTAVGVTTVNLQYILVAEQPVNLGDPVVEQFMTGAAWYAQFQPVAIAGSAYNGKYVAIIEPPERNGTAVSSTLPLTGTVLAANLVRALAVRGIQSSGVARVAQFRGLDRMTPGTPLLVNRERGGYYLIPFSEPGRSTPAMAVTVNAYNGQFMEAVRIPARPILAEAEAISRAQASLGRRGTQVSASLIAENGSRFAPEWRVRVDNDEVTIDQNGKARRRPVERKGNCEVRVNGSVVLTVSAADRNDCYRQTSFGSENCNRYKQYFKPGDNLLEQFFNGTDRVNSDRCRR